MLRLIKYFFLGLVLLLVCFASALLAMRFAIHGREVPVPKFIGMTPTEAERLATSEGLVLSMDNRFYSADVPEGNIVSQLPAPDTKVRRGWKVRIAVSLGPQRASVPNVVGESERVAELNISRRGLEIGTVATIRFPGARPSTVIAQNPPADARNALSPKIGLIMSAADNSQSYVMPNFVGHSLTETVDAVKQQGFTLGKVDLVQDAGGLSEIIVRQFPAPGQKISGGTTISFVVRKQ